MPSIYHLLARQIPAHIREQYPVFCKFIEYYYRWLQTRGFTDIQSVSNIDSESRAITLKDYTRDLDQWIGYQISNLDGAVAEVIGVSDDRLIIRYLTVDRTFNVNDDIHIRRNSEDVYDKGVELDGGVVSGIETLPSAFIDHFSKMLDADQIFGTQTKNIALILRNIRSLYQAKGDEQALKYLIKVTKNVDVEVKYPWEDVLKISDGKWKRSYSCVVRADTKYWHDVPITADRIRIMYEEKDDNGDYRYKDQYITKIEVFGKQSENYDEDDPNNWWLREEHIEIDETTGLPKVDPTTNKYIVNCPWGDYQVDPVSGAIIFSGDKAGCTYGEWGNRYITPFIRFYFDEDPQVKIGQEIRIISKDEQGNDILSYVCTVVPTFDSLQIIDGGKQWQVGQIFSASKDQIWYIYTPPNPEYRQPSTITTINESDVYIEYSEQKPLIGRVTSVDDNGKIQGVEILQYGEFIPQGGAKQIIVYPIYYRGESVDPEDYKAVLQLQYTDVGQSEGYYQDSSSWISYEPIRIQDSNYWQQFSYDVVSNVDGSTYYDMAQLLHPVGTKMFTTYMIEGDLNASAQFDIDVHTAYSSVSLYDIATTTDQLVKEIIKNITELSPISDYLIKDVTKSIKEQVGFVDGAHKENNVLYQVEYNYDAPEQK